MNGATNGVADSSQSFLTAAQRESLDAALALKEKTTSAYVRVLYAHNAFKTLF